MMADEDMAPIAFTVSVNQPQLQARFSVLMTSTNDKLPP
jgi:hypothetical protein